MNLPNKLTISRFILTVAFLAVMFSQVRYHQTIALVLFVAGGISDFLDGQIARRQNLITNFGILMDPLADKIMVCSAFIAFVGLNWMPAWMVVIVVSRELAITGLRLLAASKNVVLAAEGYGKHKTVSQIVAIISILVMASYPDWGALGQNILGLAIIGKSPWVNWFTKLSIWVAVGLTFVSGWLYLWRNRALYLQDM
jgi:CDP-diacylglycerol--glycerol-3-phosphate 3-phosphatidyltransferase